MFRVRGAATNLLRDWREAHAMNKMSNSQLNTYTRMWKKPPVGWVKINIDAGTFPNGCIGIRNVIRDSYDHFMRENFSHVEGS